MAAKAATEQECYSKTLWHSDAVDAEADRTELVYETPSKTNS